MGPWGGVEGFETEVSWGEVKLLVVKGVVGDMHLAISTSQGAISLNDCGSVVIEAGGAAFEEACDDYDFFFFGDLSEQVG